MLHSNETIVVAIREIWTYEHFQIDTIDAACVMYEKVLNEYSDEFYNKIVTAVWQGCNSTKNMKPKWV